MLHYRGHDFIKRLGDLIQLGMLVVVGRLPVSLPAPPFTFLSTIPGQMVLGGVREGFGMGWEAGVVIRFA